MQKKLNISPNFNVGMKRILRERIYEEFMLQISNKQLRIKKVFALYDYNAVYCFKIDSSCINTKRDARLMKTAK